MQSPDYLFVRPPKSGRFHRLRRLIQVVVSALFLVAPFIDLLRFDLEHKAMILAGDVYALGESGPIYLLLLLGLLLVFAWSLLYGRLWCGWMCPQTTLSELASTIERWFAGNRRLTRLRRVMSSAIIVLFAALVAASVVSYFLNPEQWLAPSLLALVCWLLLWPILSVDLLIIRHDFCIATCPYGILQGVIQDESTLGVEFDEDLKPSCIACGGCYRSCFLGIDIRCQSFSPLCFNCGDCIDGTNASHDKRKIRHIRGFAFGRNRSGWPKALASVGIVDFRRAAVIALTLAIGVLFVRSVHVRGPIGGRVAPRFEGTTCDSTGLVTNRYVLTLNNRTLRPIDVKLATESNSAVDVLEPKRGVTLGAAESMQVGVALRSNSRSISSGVHPVTLRIVTLDGGNSLGLATKFFVPERGA